MRLIFVCLIFSVVGCSTASNNENPKTTDPAPPNEPSTASSGPSLSISLTEDDLIFRYFENGSIKVVTTFDDVPVDQRHAVYVDNLKVSPTERQSNQYLQRYDLSQPSEDKRYQGTPVLRSDLEAQLERLRPKPVAPKSKPTNAKAPSQQVRAQAKVTLYSTQSCGYCKKARKFLTKNQIPFKEKDIEKSPASRKELQVKAQRAGVRVNGVPVLDVNGQIISGFNPDAILNALGG